MKNQRESNLREIEMEITSTTTLQPKLETKTKKSPSNRNKNTNIHGDNEEIRSKTELFNSLFNVKAKSDKSMIELKRLYL